MDDFDLMQIQAEALFRYDDNGRLLYINDVGRPPAPRFFLGYTAVGSIFRLRFDLPDDLADTLTALGLAITATTGITWSRGGEALAERARDARLKPRLGEAMSGGAPSPKFVAMVAEAFGSGECFEQIRAVLEAHAPIRQVNVGPAYHFPTETTAIPPLASEAILVGPRNQELLNAELRDWAPELDARLPCFVIARDGRAVAICCSSRLTARAAEAGVETIAAYRGRGFGAAVVFAWAAEVRRGGRRPLYSTAWNNDASQGVAQRLGLIRYGIDVSIY